VNKKFDDVEAYSIRIPIKYPSELSKPVSQKAISINEESPLVLSVKNMSTLPLGTDHGRILQFRIIVSDGTNNLTWVPY
jgi:hypothetical protein